METPTPPRPPTPQELEAAIFKAIDSYLFITGRVNKPYKLYAESKLGEDGTRSTYFKVE